MLLLVHMVLMLLNVHVVFDVHGAHVSRDAHVSRGAKSAYDAHVVSCFPYGAHYAVRFPWVSGFLMCTKAVCLRFTK